MLELLALGDTGWGDELLRGAGMTVIVAVLSFVTGVAIGMTGAGAKLSGSLLLRAVAEIYTTVARGVPELLIIYLFAFGLNPIAQNIAALVGYTERIDFDPFTIGVVAVATISGAYSTEVLRGAILTIPRGQIEAARAVGMHRWLVFRRIMLPQVMRFALPGLGNVWQLTLKDTALVSVIPLTELMRAAFRASGSTREPFIFLLAAYALYLVMTSFSTVAFERAERHFGRGVRRA
ncbi:MAG: ABC transporter permease [Inquilinus sp.]|nr:ABC transporter permease [Inquilinus sp.]